MLSQTKTFDACQVLQTFTALQHLYDYIATPFITAA